MAELHETAAAAISEAELTIRRNTKFTAGQDM